MTRSANSNLLFQAASLINSDYCVIFTKQPGCYAWTVMKPRVRPEVESTVFMASKSTLAGTHTGGYLYRLTSSSKNMSLATEYAPSGTQWPPPCSPIADRRKLTATCSPCVNASTAAVLKVSTVPEYLILNNMKYKSRR